MTDPRLIECAKALYEAQRPRHHATWERLPEAEQLARVPDARACILKWLEQMPSKEALAAAQDRGDVTLLTAARVVDAMTAQARREIQS